MVKYLKRTRSLGKNLILIVTTFVLSSVNSVALAGSSNNVSTFRIPDGKVMQRTVYNQSEFAALDASKVNYQIIYGGDKLISLSPKLDYLSSQAISSAGGAWTYKKDGSIIGITGCIGLVFGLDDCSSISNLVTGEKVITAQKGNPIDPHELISDDHSNYWFFSDPKSDCSKAIELCKKYNIPLSKVFSDCQINEFDSQGTPLFIWKASEHIPGSMIISSYLKEAPRGKYVDLFHCNSIDLVNNNSLLISSRNTNSLFLVDISTSAITWKFGGRYWPGVSVLASGFGTKVGSETIAQHDARFLGDGVFSYYDDNSHTSDPAKGVVFRIEKIGNTNRAVMEHSFIDPTGFNSLCTGSNRKSDLGNTIVGWGCSLNAITLFDSAGKPIVSLDEIETPETTQYFSHTPLIFNGVDWGPGSNYNLSYRVLPVFSPQG